MVRVLGIDLSGRTTGRTVLALVEGGAGTVPEARLVRSHDGARVGRRPELRQIAAIAADLAVDLVAIDAPLTFPHPWTCEADDCDRCFPAGGEDANYTIRACEEHVAWVPVARAPISPMATSMLGALAARGVYLRRAVEREGLPTLETWPAGVLTQLVTDGAPRKPSSSNAPEAYVSWARPILAAHVRMPSPDEVDDPDAVDAIAAGLGGWVHATGAGCEHVGDDEAVICVPAAASR